MISQREARATGRQPAERTSRLGALPGEPRLETLLYGAIFVAAVLTRFWDLGSRALHHDESLHAYFSWIYAEGLGYQHDPLMHGPFLFHANALLYLLFGASDYVSRIMPAVAGVAVVMLPWLLRGRGLLGRWGALAASALLLVSPSILYYSRFIRHDLYALLGTFMLFIAVLRYVESPAPRWAITGGIAAGFLLTTKEVSFISLFILASFVFLAVALRSARELVAVLAGAGVLAVAGMRVLQAMGVAELPGIPWQSPTTSDIGRFTRDLVTHPLVLLLLGVGLLAVIAAILLLRRRVRPEQGWITSILDSAPTGSISTALGALLTERRPLWIGLAGGATIFVALYTSLFTNLGGLASGTFGALGYWLGQHGVQRGEQPWFYYLLLLPQYEFVAAALLPFGALLTVARAVRARRSGAGLDRRDYTRVFFLYWALGMLLILSWAGEKMPWLAVHIALPLTLLAASLIGEAIEWITRRSAAERRRGRRLSAGLVVSGVMWFLLLAWASAGPYVGQGTTLLRVIRPEIADHWWITAIPPLLAVALLLIGAWTMGRRGIASVGAITLAALLIGAQVHRAWPVVYRQGDVPEDMLVYVQTAPDVTRVMTDLTRLSEEMTGGMGLDVWYDSGTQWPLNWYLRDFPNRHFFGTTLAEPPNAPVVLVAREFVTPQVENALTNYTYQEYAMRWWFPEEATYRRFAIAPELNEPSRQNYQTSEPGPYSVGDVARSVGSSIASLREPQQQADLFRLVAFRELPEPIGTYRFRVYIRRDLVPAWNSLRY